MSANTTPPKAVDLNRADKKIWLVKIPNFVAQRWRIVCEDSTRTKADAGPELGRVRINLNAAQASSDISLSLTGPTAEGIPKEYRMRPQTGDTAVLHAFAEEPAQISVNGRVDQRFDVEMGPGASGEQSEGGIDPEYRKLSRERNRAASTKTRTALVIDPLNSRTSLSQTIANRRKVQARPEKKQIEKRVRMERDKLENLLFRLFERQEFWTFQNLVKETDQPVVWLKEVLPDVGVQSRKAGPHRDQWHIKPEFRVSAAPSEDMEE